MRLSIVGRPHPPLPGQVGSTGGDLTCLIIECPNMHSCLSNPLLMPFLLYRGKHGDLNNLQFVHIGGA